MGLVQPWPFLDSVHDEPTLGGPSCQPPFPPHTLTPCRAAQLQGRDSQSPVSTKAARAGFCLSPALILAFDPHLCLVLEHFSQPWALRIRTIWNSLQLLEEPGAHAQSQGPAACDLALPSAFAGSQALLDPAAWTPPHSSWSASSTECLPGQHLSPHLALPWHCLSGGRNW